MKVAFLFGAGAEGKNLYNMPSGVEYLNQTILRDVISDEKTKFKNSLGVLLEKEFSEKIFSEQDNRYKYRKDYLHGDTIIEHLFKDTIYSISIRDCEFVNQYRTLIYEILDESQINEINDLHNLEPQIDCKNGNEVKDLSQNDQFLEIKKIMENYGKKRECELSDFQKKFFEEEENVKFSNNVVLSGGFLDEKFHTIISPDKYGIGKFSKVFNYYWSCFFCIINAIRTKYQELFPEIDNEDVSIDSLLSFTKKIYEENIVFRLDEKVQNSYYKLLDKDVLKKQGIQCTGVLTTNYTPFVKRMRVESEKIAYVNGQLNLFEIPGGNQVVDITKYDLKKEKYLFFPFIFGQSKIKPIVHPLQIEEYNKMSKILIDDGTEVLVSIGYGINSDDNHLNAYIKYFLERDDKKAFIVVSENSKEEIKRNLRLDDTNQIVLIPLKNNDSYRNAVEIVSDVVAEIQKKKDLSIT